MDTECIILLTGPQMLCLRSVSQSLLNYLLQNGDARYLSVECSNPVNTYDF